MSFPAPTTKGRVFFLAHESLGHFGVGKPYLAVKDAYYWPNMKPNLETTYILACEDWQRNKHSTRPHAGPLYLLPIANNRFDSVFIDFVGPMPEDTDFNYLCTATDQVGANIKLIPIWSELTAEEFAHLFFDHSYCEHASPIVTAIVSSCRNSGVHFTNGVESSCA